jgi:anti-sigma regulatory factor (Ser/Thr protein kinase)
MPSEATPRLVQVGEVTVPSGPHAPFLARTAVSRWLDRGAHARLHEDACLLVSELVTNSVRHAGQPAGAPVRVRAFVTDDVVRVEVEDDGHGLVRPRFPDAGEGGLGLYFVELLATRWGSSHERGTRVWFELALPGRAT